MCDCSRSGGCGDLLALATGVHSIGNYMILEECCSGSTEAARIVGVLSRLSDSGVAHRLGLVMILETIENTCKCLRHGGGWPQAHILWWRPEQAARQGPTISTLAVVRLLAISLQHHGCWFLPHVHRSQGWY